MAAVQLAVPLLLLAGPAVAGSRTAAAWLARRVGLDPAGRTAGRPPSRR